MSNRRSALTVARTGAAGRGPIRALHLRGETVKRVSLIGAILAARCAEGSESTSAAYRGRTPSTAVECLPDPVAIIGERGLG